MVPSVTRLRVVGADVVEIADAAEDLVAEDGAPLRLRLRAMDSQREDDEDVAIGHARAIQRLDHRRQQQIGAGEPRDVVDDDRHLLAGLDDFGERRRADGVRQRFENGGGFIRDRTARRDARSGPHRSAISIDPRP